MSALPDPLANGDPVFSSDSLPPDISENAQESLHVYLSALDPANLGGLWKMEDGGFRIRLL